MYARAFHVMFCGASQESRILFSKPVSEVINSFLKFENSIVLRLVIGECAHTRLLTVQDAESPWQKIRKNANTIVRIMGVK
jgi:hypothetical protein